MKKFVCLVGLFFVFKCEAADLNVTVGYNKDVQFGSVEKSLTTISDTANLSVAVQDINIFKTNYYLVGGSISGLSNKEGSSGGTDKTNAEQDGWLDVTPIANVGYIQSENGNRSAYADVGMGFEAENVYLKLDYLASALVRLERATVGYNFNIGNNLTVSPNVAFSSVQTADNPLHNLSAGISVTFKM
jgi:hypothetical protein